MTMNKANATHFLLVKKYNWRNAKYENKTTSSGAPRFKKPARIIVAASTAYETRLGVIMIRSPLFNSIRTAHCQLRSAFAVECGVLSAQASPFRSATLFNHAWPQDSCRF